MNPGNIYLVNSGYRFALFNPQWLLVFRRLMRLACVKYLVSRNAVETDSQRSRPEVAREDG